jgi:hypothetical protein
MKKILLKISYILGNIKEHISGTPSVLKCKVLKL